MLSASILKPGSTEEYGDYGHPDAFAGYTDGVYIWNRAVPSAYLKSNWRLVQVTQTDGRSQSLLWRDGSAIVTRDLSHG